MKRLALLVAANHPSRDLVAQIVSTRNYRVLYAALDGGLAAAVCDDAPDVAVLVLGPPDKPCAEGVAAYAAFREAINALPAGRPRPARVIVCGPPDTKPEADRRGDFFVPLPLDRDALLGAIETVTRGLVTILVADDEPFIRRMFSMYLGNEGYKVVAAEDGEEAIRKVREVLPDLVITDIKMPHADGYEVCRAIKESRDTQHIPVIIVSALAGELDIDKGFNAGANEYLTKPVDLVELAGRIQNILRGIALRGRESILVVTPSQIERSILEYGLSQQGFEVMATRDGEEALEYALARPPGVIICDIEIPVLDAFTLRSRLLAREASRDVPFLAITSRASKVDKARRDQLQASAFITKPFPIERLVALIERILGERRVKLEREREILLQTIKSLVQALEARDRYTRGHSDNVARYTVMIARHYYEREEQIARIQLSAQLHDIGKIGVPDAILLKPGKLTEEEMAIMQTHPVKGAEILQPIPSLQDIIPGVRWHHERLDGRGYPDALKGDEIPLQARIIAVADTFDALTSNRPYRQRTTVERALEVLRGAVGDQLDPECVAIFCQAVAETKLVLPEPAPV